MKQQEQVDWDDVNKLLQHHGFKPVFFADPVENRNLTDLVLLDKKSVNELRTTLRMMLMDSERRQALIQELVKANNQLKEDVQKHMSSAAQQFQRATELQALLDEVRRRVQDLEERCLGKAVQQNSHTQELQKENKKAQRRCQSLEQKGAKLEEEAAQLRAKLYFAVKAEEQRMAQQSQTSQISKQSSAGQLSAKGDAQPSRHRDQTPKRTGTSASPSFKTILQEYQEQQKESSSQIQELRKEVDLLRKELNTRCGSDQSSNSRQCVEYHHLLTQINAIVANPRLRQHQQRPSGFGQTEFHALLPTLDHWSQQLHMLGDLRVKLNKLAGVLMLPQRWDGDSGEDVRVEAMTALVEVLLENAAENDKQKYRSPTRCTLASMVSHFQKLFDVPSLSGVYPRMNEVYTRLGELTNALRNLRNILDLDNKASPIQVVNLVSRLVSLETGLGGADIDSIILKVKQHEEFFPAFHKLVTEVLKSLDVSHLDDILPALESLKQAA